MTKPAGYIVKIPAVCPEAHNLITSSGDYCFECTCGDWFFSWEDSATLDMIKLHNKHRRKFGLKGPGRILPASARPTPEVL
jgi:hypothetical protein